MNLERQSPQTAASGRRHKKRDAVDGPNDVRVQDEGAPPMSIWLARPACSERAQAFAERDFAECKMHREEAAAVYRAIEFLSRKEQPDLNPDTTIADILGPITGALPPGLDSLDTIELVMVMEEE